MLRHDVLSNLDDKLLDSSVITITGGTGSFGVTMTQSLLNQNIAEVRILSRDEKKQDDMRNSFLDKRLKFIIGDVRDKKSVDFAIDGADYVFHAAALKQVPSCEFFPMQAVETNINGSANVIESSIKHNIKTIVCLSTDKSVYPINAMGMTKSLMEKVAQSYVRNAYKSNTKIMITRYGNVMMSNGSVIPLFLDQIREGRPITITDPAMTRFMMSLSDSVSLVKYAFTSGSSGDIFVKKAPACTISNLIIALSRIMGVENQINYKVIGKRHGEKLYESLLGSEEMNLALDKDAYFRVPIDSKTLDYQLYFNEGIEVPPEIDSFTSHNTYQLTVEEIIEMIRTLPEFLKYQEHYS